MNEGFGIKNTIGPTLSLFASAGTLICCALPALLVSIGMGAALAGLISAVPGLIWLSKYKLWVFGIAAFLIALSGIMQWRSRNLSCPADFKQAKACTQLRKISWWIWSVAAVSYMTGFFFAFIAPKVFF